LLGEQLVLMAKIYTIHPDTPQARIVEQVQIALQGGAVMLYPTDTVYAIGCDLHNKAAVTRVKQIKQLANDKPVTFLCPSLSDIASYAVVSDAAYRIMRHLIPGPYTFLLPATKLVPRLVMNPKRKTTGIRVPDQPFCQSLLAALGHPIISTSAHVPQDEEGGNGKVNKRSTSAIAAVELFDRLDKVVDLIIDDGTDPGIQVSTILDLTGEEPLMVRQGLGWETVADWGITPAHV
jgi:tRNA threonylcarbamoyl adenosine modification protein (Sua5/YciO/YrdC/YwlC family)